MILEIYLKRSVGPAAAFTPPQDPFYKILILKWAAHLPLAVLCVIFKQKKIIFFTIYYRNVPLEMLLDIWSVPPFNF